MPECRHLVSDLQLEFYQRDVITCRVCGARWTRNSVFNNLGHGTAQTLFAAFVEQLKNNELFLENILAEGRTLENLEIVEPVVDRPADDDATWRDKA